MQASLGSAEAVALHERHMEKLEVEVEVEENASTIDEADLSGSSAADDRVRKKKRLDARRLKQTRAKTHTRSPEEIPIKDQGTVTQIGRLGGGSVDPFGSLPDLDNGETNFLAYHCK